MNDYTIHSADNTVLEKQLNYVFDLCWQPKLKCEVLCSITFNLEYGGLM